MSQSNTRTVFSSFGDCPANFTDALSYLPTCKTFPSANHHVRQQCDHTHDDLRRVHTSDAIAMPVPPFATVDLLPGILVRSSGGSSSLVPNRSQSPHTMGCVRLRYLHTFSNPTVHKHPLHLGWPCLFEWIKVRKYRYSSTLMGSAGSLDAQRLMDPPIRQDVQDQCSRRIQLRDDEGYM